MEIYNGYSTDDVLMNEPCIVDDMAIIYPILLKEYSQFVRNSSLFMIGRQHVNGNLLHSIISGGIAKLCNGDVSDIDYKTLELYLNITLLEISKIIAIVTHKNIIYTTNWDSMINDENNYLTATFTDEEGTILINDSNWDIFREIVMKQNNLKEEKVYKDKLYEKWLKKAQIANSSKEDMTLGDMITIISCATGKTYEEIKNQNMLQIYSDYYRVSHVANYEATTLFRTVCDKVTPMNFGISTVKELYRDRENDYTFSSGEIANKL